MSVIIWEYGAVAQGGQAVAGVWNWSAVAGASVSLVYGPPGAVAAQVSLVGAVRSGASHVGAVASEAKVVGAARAGMVPH
jgi:hypothetical protein